MPCSYGKCRHKHTDKKQLYGEALVVGAALVPMWFAVSMATDAMRLNFSGKAAFDVFLSGLLFHLAAEETGVNEWYLTNSHAAKKTFSTTIDSPLYNAMAISESVDWERIASVVHSH